MSTYFRWIVVLAALLVAVSAYSPLARADDTMTIEQAYQNIKNAERLIPVPTPVATQNVGTFDGATGKFEGLTVETEVINGKPTRIVPQVRMNAVNARLVFGIRNATRIVRVSVAGVGSAIAAVGRTSVSIDVGRLRDVRWSITYGTLIHRDELTIKRPRIIGAGAFTIPALPVAVVYDPPQNPAGTNSVVYTRSVSAGFTVGLTISRGTGTVAPASAPKFSAAGIFNEQLTEAANFASATNTDIASALGIIKDVLGKAERNVETKDDHTSTSTRTFKITDARTCPIDDGVTHLGPGRSDQIVFLRNARLVWLDDGLTTYLQFLGFERTECPTIDHLRSGVAAVDPAAAAALIALDPFAGPLGPKAPLATDPRYVQQPGIALLPDLVQTITFTQEDIVGGSSAQTSTRTVTDDLGAGLLSIVGVAPSETKTVTSTLSIGTTQESTDSTTVTTALTARTLVEGARTELNVFYDRVFGTLAFQDPRP
jgi:hypothetical protein